MGTGREIQIRDLARRIADLVGYEGALEYDTSRPDGQPRRCVDTARALRHLGFRARVPLREGLERTIRWYRDQGGSFRLRRRGAGSGGRVMIRHRTDFLCIGGGVIGLTLALQLQRRYPDARVTLLEKERACGMHASGRNSGVLHAGFYYTGDSLKARFSRDGNLALQAYCEERHLPVKRCGKLVVARDETELAALDELLRRAGRNGVELHPVSEAEARELEPRARTVDQALYSPTTATVDPRLVVSSLVRDAGEMGIRVLTDTKYLSVRDGVVRTSDGPIAAGYVVNAAGLFADQIARDFGFGEDYRILPFKGIYLHARGANGMLRRHVYPVPELRYPFLGVHWTLTVTGDVKIGPTAIPGLWREHYTGLSGFRPAELLEIGGLVSRLLWTNAFEFRSLARREAAKYFRRHLIRKAGELVRELPSGVRWRWGEPGVRAQLVNVRERRLQMDFHYEGDDRSFHVLNAVSPAFTCAFPFAEFLTARIDEFLEHRPALSGKRGDRTANPGRKAAAENPSGLGASPT